LLNLLDHWLVDRPDLRRMFAIWIRATLMRKAEYRILLPAIDDLQELKVMLAERLEEWAHAYKAEGVEQGLQQGVQIGVQRGESLALQKLLTRRFGAIPSDIAIRIAAASIEEIDAWFDQAIDADCLDDVLGNS